MGAGLGVITVSNFFYSGSNDVFGEGVLDQPPSFVNVAPSLPFGASGLRLTFSGGWTSVDISYTAQAERPWIRQFNLLLLVGGNGGVSANGLGVSRFFEEEHLFATRSFDPISLAPVSITGSSAFRPLGGLNTFAFDVVTPEPTTLLIWATAAAGLGLANWQRGRKHRDNVA